MFAWTEAFEWIEHAVATQHALSESLLAAMEEWAAKQPAALPDALEAVERISELLDLSGLFSALLLHPRRDRKSLFYTGGIRVSGLDFGSPAPTALWSPTSRRTGAVR